MATCTACTQRGLGLIVFSTRSIKNACSSSFSRLGIGRGHTHKRFLVVTIERTERIFCYTPLMPVVPLPYSFVAKVQETCATYPLVLVYLFGSYAREKADAESDVDIAVLSDDGSSPQERLRLRLCLTRALADALAIPIEKIDVVVLQDVSILLQYNVIRKGKLIFAKGPSARIAYTLEVERRYEDELPFLERETEMTLQRLRSSTH